MSVSIKTHLLFELLAKANNLGKLADELQIRDVASIAPYVTIPRSFFKQLERCEDELERLSEENNMTDFFVVQPTSFPYPSNERGRSFGQRYGSGTRQQQSSSGDRLAGTRPGQRKQQTTRVLLPVAPTPTENVQKSGHGGTNNFQQALNAGQVRGRSGRVVNTTGTNGSAVVEFSDNENTQETGGSVTPDETPTVPKDGGSVDKENVVNAGELAAEKDGGADANGDEQENAGGAGPEDAPHGAPVQHLAGQNGQFGQPAGGHIGGGGGGAPQQYFGPPQWNQMGYNPYGYGLAQFGYWQGQGHGHNYGNVQGYGPNGPYGNGQGYGPNGPYGNGPGNGPNGPYGNGQGNGPNGPYGNNY